MQSKTLGFALQQRAFLIWGECLFSLYERIQEADGEEIGLVLISFGHPLMTGLTSALIWQRLQGIKTYLG